jgi:glycosyltransferase involved in cell wall biosynthesis
MAADIMGRLAGFLTRRPVVSTIHNNRADYDKEPLRRRMLERWTARLHCSRIVAVSDNLRAEIADWFGVPLSRVVAIPNGIDTERFAPGSDFDRGAIKRALSGGNFALITNVGRLMPQKAQVDFIKAAGIVSRSQPDARFLLVGDGPLRGDLTTQASELGIAEKVIFTGFRADMPEVLAASEIFVLSSAWEGLPIALLEAMAARCTVVCTAVGGVPQVIEHGVTGLLVPPADPQALAQALLECLQDPGFAGRLATAGQDWVRRVYGVRGWVRSLETLYLEEYRRSVRMRNAYHA